MESVDVRVVTPDSNTGLQVSMEPALCALSSRFAARGLSKSVLDTAAEQIKREEETRQLAPDAYRLSSMTEAMINGRYRKGKHSMSSSDVIGYFAETRNRRIQNIDFSKCESEEPEIEETALSVTADRSEQSVKPAFTRIKEKTWAAGKGLVTAIPTWFNGDRPDTSSETRRFPLSAFAALLAVAMSLMLIVASTIMLNRAENDLSELRQELSALTDEVSELSADFGVRNDLREIRRIAIEEDGMVGEEYIKMQYITMDGEESVETFEEERGGNVSLDAILSAIGIKK